MISYRDQTFCPHYRDCASAETCSRPLTPEVAKAAKATGLPIALFVERPECHVPNPEQPSGGGAA